MIGHLCQADLLQDVLQQLPEVTYLDSVGLSCTAHILVSSGMLSELLTDHVYTDWLWKQVKAQEYALKLRKGKHVTAI